ncbi:Carbohydrate sulfotransferase 14 [Chionoecetes opilio]|uniref:Carbohydrate sulfotransferase n=1 Tax=Chionoecetes opilio TaxID=41210 RepID=A0A8J4YLJ1_CHIOP|nr:Carbohydrate sulfotransferase 14 [Chionoecetes opilio]
MTARHPLDRLVSAYRDKFHDGAPMPSSNSFSQSALKELQRRGERGNVSFTFTEFLTHVLKEQSRDGLKNIHWRNYYRTCSPCALPYDFIMNTETFSEDLKYIVHKLGAKEIRVDWRFHVAPHNTTTTTSPHYMHYYTNITHALLKRVYHQYKIDFQMFGYEIPAVLKGALS